MKPTVSEQTENPTLPTAPNMSQLASSMFLRSFIFVQEFSLGGSAGTGNDRVQAESVTTRTGRIHQVQNQKI